MKKFIGILVLSLLFCSSSFAEYLEFRKCHLGEYKSFQEAQDANKPLDPIVDDIITINTDAGTVTRTIIRSADSAKSTTELLSALAGKKISTPKIKQNIFGIQTYAAGLITAEGFIDEMKIKKFIDISSMTIDMQITIYGSDGKVLMSGEKVLKCEEDFTTGNEENSGSSGTAFFINNRGNLLTNNHVVDGCKSLSINYNNKEYDAQLIATDKTLDLALLKANVRSKSFINFSNYNPKKLQKIYVAGYPFGKGLSDDLKISSGIISSLKGVQDNSNELQIDAAINHGNSGGPIVGEGGELIAIAVSGPGKEMSEGINFGIKSSAALNFLGANDIDPSRSNRNKLNNDKLLKILEESPLYISCTY